jgi:primosomal protein N' (replication factor Y) (superfamily II helicase)
MNVPLDSVVHRLEIDLDSVSLAEVVVMIDAPDLAPTYSYRIPDSLQNTVSVGGCVLVPFGSQDAVGYVLEIRHEESGPGTARLKEIESVVEGAVTFQPHQATLARYISERYLSSVPDAVRCIAPSSMGSKFVRTVRLSGLARSADRFEGTGTQSHVLTVLRAMGGEATVDELRKRARINALSGALSALIRKGFVEEESGLARPQTVTRTIRAYRRSNEPPGDGYRVSPAGSRLLDALARLAGEGNRPVLPEQLLTEAQAGATALKTLVEAGLVERIEVPLRRAATIITEDRTSPPVLSAGQQNAATRLGRAIKAGKHRQALLFGVTASGKTEVYLDAIARTLEAGRSAVVLVPEIALTTQVVSAFTGRFGDEVAVLHSRLSEGERHDEWRRLQDGHARIAVGARSAVFAPAIDVGLIVVDEEHEGSYKQESAPRYLARDVAAERGRIESAIVLLGSATPSVETFYETEQGRIARLDMPDRIDNRPLPSVSVVDMREEFKEHKALFSQRLVEELGQCLGRKQQAILFLNRRGYSQFILCRDCGYVARCPNCAVSLAYHASWGALKCHHCGHNRRAPVTCPDCKGERIKGFGIGTERVEEEVLKLFPESRVARMDRDTTARKGTHQAILDRFRHGQADVLIGTQMVAKGLDFPNVTVVGVVSADTSINMPDFRAAERTFQLLTQVAGRAGRGVHPGEVIVQTFTPEHYAVQAAPSQDYPAFYDQEIKFREELRYPPFRRFANIVSSDENSSDAKGRAEAFASAARRAIPSSVEVLGPAPAGLSRLKSLYRWHVEVRAPSDEPLSSYVRHALSLLSSGERARLTVDIDAYNLA